MMDIVEQNKQTLELANAAISAGDYEGFLSYCTEDTIWDFVGEQTLHGKDAVRQYMAQTYLEPPKFKVERLIADRDSVVAIGKISLKDENSNVTCYDYCDVWEFLDGKLHALKAFVINRESQPEGSKRSETVIGSGYTYDEAEHPTDESEPADEVKDEDIVDLPDLGKPNRP